MKYLNIKALNRSIERTRTGNITHEHRTGTAANGLLNNYFNLETFAITPEQIQPGTKREPDFSVEKLQMVNKEEVFVPHCYVEIKSLKNSNISNILEILADTIHENMDTWRFSGTYPVFMIAMKGTKIAFFTYHIFQDEFFARGVANYKGFIPLNMLIDQLAYERFCVHSWMKPLTSDLYKSYERGLSNFAHDRDTLRQIGAEATNQISYPHILDLENPRHKEHIHEMFRYMADKSANKIIKKNPSAGIGRQGKFKLF